MPGVPEKLHAHHRFQEGDAVDLVQSKYSGDGRFPGILGVRILQIRVSASADSSVTDRCCIGGGRHPWRRERTVWQAEAEGRQLVEQCRENALLSTMISAVNRGVKILNCIRTHGFSTASALANDREGTSNGENAERAQPVLLSRIPARLNILTPRARPVCQKHRLRRHLFRQSQNIDRVGARRQCRIPVLGTRKV